MLLTPLILLTYISYEVREEDWNSDMSLDSYDTGQNCWRFGTDYMHFLDIPLPIFWGPDFDLLGSRKVKYYSVFRQAIGDFEIVLCSNEFPIIAPF